MSSCIANYAELENYKREGAKLLITLLGDNELKLLGVPLMNENWKEAWLQLPIHDFGVPNEAFETEWLIRKNDIHTRLDNGETIALHCRAGLGRTGTIAAKILIERGMQSSEAIDYVRKFRTGAIETEEQKDYLLNL